MDASAVFASINWLAVVVAAVVGFAIGAPWYGPLFGKAWMRASGVTEEMARSANPAKIYGTTILLNLVVAVSLAMFIGPQGTLASGTFAGFMAGLTYVAAAFGVTYLFEMRPLSLWFINAGYWVVLMTAMGAIIGAWR
jgi:hypothetical protein